MQIKFYSIFNSFQYFFFFFLCQKFVLGRNARRKHYTVDNLLKTKSKNIGKCSMYVAFADTSIAV